MTTVKVRVLRRHPYGGKTRRPGEFYEAADKHAEILSLAGAVSLEPARLVVKQPIPEQAPEKKRRSYRRRDMEAEDQRELDGRL
jgi:hypothetical protein